MYNPKKIFTKDGYKKYKLHLTNIDDALFYILNHADDLHIGSTEKDKDIEDALYKMKHVIENKSLLRGIEK